MDKSENRFYREPQTVDNELNVSALADACEVFVYAYRGRDDGDLAELVAAIAKALGQPTAPDPGGVRAAIRIGGLRSEIRLVAAKNLRLTNELATYKQGLRDTVIANSALRQTAGSGTTDDDDTCGDCVEGHCHWGGADPAPGEQCGCARHTASMLARERNTQQHTDATARWKVGDIARWQYRATSGYPEWFTVRLLDDSPNTDHDWHGKVINPGTYPDARVGTDMYVMENCLSVVPAGQEGGAPIRSRLSDQAVIDEPRKQGWAPADEQPGDVVEAVAKALHDYEHGGAHWHSWKDITDFGRDYWMKRADVAVRAHYAAYHTPYADEEHQGGNLLDLYLKTYAGLFRLKNQVPSSTVTRAQVRKTAEVMWDLADKHSNWQQAMELAFASAGIEVRDE